LGAGAAGDRSARAAATALGWDAAIDVVSPGEAGRASGRAVPAFGNGDGLLAASAATPPRDSIALAVGVAAPGAVCATTAAARRRWSVAAGAGAFCAAVSSVCWRASVAGGVAAARACRSTSAGGNPGAESTRRCASSIALFVVGAPAGFDLPSATRGDDAGAEGAASSRLPPAACPGSACCFAAACDRGAAADGGTSLATTFVSSTSRGCNCHTPIAIAPMLAAAAKPAHAGHDERARAVVDTGCACTARCAAARIASSSAGGGSSCDCARHSASSSGSRSVIAPFSAHRSCEILQRRTQLRARVAQPALHRLLAGAGDRGDLGERQPAFVLQQERVALLARQRRQRGGDALANFARRCANLRL